MGTRIYRTTKAGNSRVTTSWSLKDAGILAIVIFPFWLIWWVLKLYWYLFKWLFYTLPKRILNKASGSGNTSVETSFFKFTPMEINGFEKKYFYQDMEIFTPQKMTIVPESTINKYTILSLTQEPANEYDNKAVALYYRDFKVGYLYRGEVQEMANKWLKRGWPVYGYFRSYAAEEDDLTASIGLCFYQPEAQ